MINPFQSFLSQLRAALFARSRRPRLRKPRRIQRATTNFETLEERVVLTPNLGSYLTTEHVDLNIAYGGGVWSIGPRDSDADPAVQYSADDALLYAGSPALTSRPAGSQFDFIGVDPSEDFYLLPATQDVDLLYLGFSGYGVSGGSLDRYNPSIASKGRTSGSGRWIKVALVGLTHTNPDGTAGTGQVSMWQSGDTGPGVFLSSYDDGIANPDANGLDTTDGISADDAMWIIAGGHSHYNFGFTQPGRYAIQLQTSSYFGDNGDNTTPNVADFRVSQPMTIYVSVGSVGQLEIDSDTYTVDEAAGTASVTVNRVGGSDGRISVNYFTSNGTATDTEDYTPVTGTVIFEDGETSKVITIPILDDLLTENDETLQLTLSEPGPSSINDYLIDYEDDANGLLGSRVSSTITIIDDDDPPTISSIDDLTIDEDTSTGALTFTISDPQTAAESLTLSASSSNSTLVPIENIVFGGSGTNRTVTITPAATLSGLTTITITVTDASGFTATETFDLTVTAINDVPLANSQTFSTDQGTPVAVILTGSDEETQDLDFIIVSPPSHGTLSGTAPNFTYTPDVNFGGLDTITFKVNDGSQDSALATIAIHVGTLGQVEFTSATYTVNEMAAYRDITVRRIGGSDGRLVVQYASADGTATAAAPDYTSTTGFLVFEDGETSKVITIQTANQSTAIVEPNETFSLTLTVPPEYIGQDILGANSTAVITINDSPTISTVAAQTTAIGTPTSPIAFTVYDTATAAGDLQISVLSSNPTLIPLSGIVLDGSEANRTLTVTPVAGLSGKSTITVIVTDSEGATAVRAFEITVGPATTATAITLPATLPDVVITADESFTLNYKITNSAWVTQVTRSNTDLFNAPGTSSTSDLRTQPNSGGTDRTLRIRGTDNSTAAGKYGTSTVTLGFTGTGAPAAQTFNVRVNPRAVADNNLLAIPGTTSTLDVLSNDVTPIAGHTFTITSVSTPVNGTLQISTDGQSVLYTPTDPDAYSDTFTYTVTITSSDEFNGFTFTGIGYVKIGGYYVVDSAIASQHTDIAINYINGEWIQNIHSDASIFGSVQSGTFSPTVVDSDEAVLFYDPSTKQARPAGTIYDALGVPVGADIWVGPTGTNGNKIYLGFNSGETSTNLIDDWMPVGDPRATSSSQWMSIGLVGFSGPGNMAVFYAGDVAFDTYDGINSADESAVGGNVSDTFWGFAGSHDHPSFIFTAPGRYSFTLQTTTSVGGVLITSPPVTFYADVDTISGDARLGENPPLANADTASAVENAGPVTINVLGNDSSSPDPDEVLAVTAVTQGTHGGTVAIAANGTVSYTPAADFSGAETFNYTITDEHGGIATSTVTITVRANDAPTALDDFYVVSAANRVEGNVLFNDSDIDGDAFTAALETEPLHGSVVITANGTFTYTPSGSFAVSDSFTYTVTDAVGASSTATVTVTAASFQDFEAIVGVGHSDVGIAYEEGAWNLHIHDDEIGEEYEPNAAMYYVAPAALTSRPAGTEFDFIGVAAGENYYRLPQTQNPELLYLGFGAEELEDGTFENGTLRVFLRSVNGPGEFSLWESGDTGPTVKFSTSNGITGDDYLEILEGGHSHYNWGFTTAGRYEITLEVVGTLTGTGSPTSATATYYFSVDNLGHFQFETASDAVGEGGSKTITVQRVGGSDGPLTVDFATSGSATAGVDYQSLSSLTFADGETEKTFTVVTVPDGDNEGDETLSISLVAPADSFTAIGTPDTLELTLVDNSAPTITAIDDLTVEEDTSSGALNFTVGDLETDPQSLIVSVGSSNPTLVPVENIGLEGSGAHRTVTITPAANQFGTADITLTVLDENGQSTTTTFRVTVTAVNDAPVILPTTDVVMNEDGDITVNFTISDVEAGTLTVTGTNTNSQLFSTIGTGTTARLRLAGTGNNRTLRIRPNPNQSGTTIVTLTARDAQNATYSLSFSITVDPVNDVPIANDDGEYFVLTNSSAILPDVLSNDTLPDALQGQTISLDSFTQGSQGTVTLTEDNLFLYTPATDFRGFDSFTYTIIDNDGDTATATVTLAVGIVDLVHTDLAINFVNGEWYSTINADYAIQAKFDSDEAVLYVNHDAAMILPELPPEYGFIGAATGDTIWMVPQTQQVGAVWLGFSNEETAAGVIASPIRFDLVSYSGPGNFSLFSNGAFGEPVLSIDTVDGLNADDEATIGGNSSDYYEILPYSHSHLNWAFTQPGRYVLEFRPSALINTTDSEGNPIQVQTQGPSVTYVIEVGTLTGLPLAENPPLARPDTFEVFEDTPTTLAVLANDSSAPDSGEALAITGVTSGSHGTVEITGDGLAVRYTPNPDYAGTDSFTYTITDEHGGITTAKVSITVNSTSDAPVGVDDSYTVIAGNAVYGNVLFNDMDADGDTLTAELINIPSSGTVTLALDGSFSYTPDGTFAGSDSFTYRVSDGTGEEAVATVTITAAMQPTFVTTLLTGHTDVGLGFGDHDHDEEHDDEEGEPGHDDDHDEASGMWNLHVHSHDDDAEYAPGEALLSINSASASIRPADPAFEFIGVGSGEVYHRLPQTENPDLLFLGIGTEEIEPGTFLGGSASLRLKSVNGPGHFSMWRSGDAGPEVLMATADGITDSDLTSVLESSHTHVNWGFSTTGRYQITFEAIATLPNGDVVSSDDVTYYFHVNNQPVAVDDDFSVGISGTLQGNVLSNDQDVDEHPLTATIVTGPSAGDLTLNSDGTFIYLPGPGFSGSDTFTYQISDGFGGTDSATVIINQENEAPTAVTLINVLNSLDENTSTATRIKIADISITDDGLGSNVLSLSGSDAGSFELDGNVLYLRANTLLNFEQQSAYQVTVHVDDIQVWTSLDTSTDFTLSVTNVNEAPTLLSGSSTLQEDTQYQGSVSSLGLDVDGDPLSYSVVEGPAHGSLTLNPDGTFLYIPNSDYTGEDAFTFTVTDSQLGGNTAVFNLTVTAIDDPLTVSLPGGDIEMSPLAGVVRLDSNAAVSDSDTAVNYGSTLLEITLAGGGQKKDVLSVIRPVRQAGPIQVRGKRIIIGGQEVAHWTGGKRGQPLRIQFGSNATESNVITVMQQIGFKTARINTAGTREVIFRVTSGGRIAEAAKNITVSSAQR